jgi:hypothetical protein
MNTSDESNSVIVQLIHFDDEPNSIFPVANSLFNRYTAKRYEWSVGEPKYNKWVEEFCLKPPNELLHRIQYKICSNDIECMRLIEHADSKTAIVLLDLEYRNGTRTEAAGKNLYIEAKRKMAIAGGSDAVSRIFVCTGYPNYLDDINNSAEDAIDTTQVIWKPFSPGRFAAKLAAIMPMAIRLQEEL